MASPDAVVPVTLHQYRPAYGVEAYLRVAAIPHHVVHAGFPSYESTGALPQVQHGSALVGGPRCVEYLRTVAKPPAESALTPAQALDLEVWVKLVESQLADLETWCTHAAGKIAGPAAFAQQSPLLLRWVSGVRHLESLGAYLTTRGLEPMDKVAAGAHAETVYRLLCQRYEQRPHALDVDPATGEATGKVVYHGPYFFGARPTTLDALVYGHLLAVRPLAMGSGWAAKHAFPALEPFFEAFTREYFDPSRQWEGQLTVTGSSLFEATQVAVDAATQRAFTAGVKARILAKEEEEAAAAAAAQKAAQEAHAAATSAPALPAVDAGAAAAVPEAPAAAQSAAAGASTTTSTAAVPAAPAATAVGGAVAGEQEEEEEEELRSPSAKRTVHNRVLTGMDDVWVGERRVRFESPMPGDASAAGGRAFEALRSPAGAAAAATAGGSGGLDGTPLPPLATPAPAASTTSATTAAASKPAASAAAAPGDAPLVARIKSFFGAGAPPRKETAAQSAALAVSAGANSVNRFGFGLPDSILKQAARDGAIESQHTAPMRDLVVTVGILATAIIIAKAAASAAR